MIAAAVAAALSSPLMVASRGGCFSGIETATGGFLDFNGQPTETEPLCYFLQLGPSPFVLLTSASSRSRGRNAGIRILHGHLARPPALTPQSFGDRSDREEVFTTETALLSPGPSAWHELSASPSAVA